MHDGPTETSRLAIVLQSRPVEKTLDAARCDGPVCDPSLSPMTDSGVTMACRACRDGDEIGREVPRRVADRPGLTHPAVAPLHVDSRTETIAAIPVERAL